MKALASARFTFFPTPLEDVWRVSRKPISDARGSFTRFYCSAEFELIGLSQSLQQINHSFSAQRGTVRGMHFQHPPHGETKVVTCLSGRIFDVAVDLRPDSRTFLQWYGVELTAENQESLVIPPGFAHGFQTLEDNAAIIYLVTASYNALAEDGLNPFDPGLKIDWPLPATEVSQRDAQRPFIDKGSFSGVASCRGERNE